MSKTKNAKRQTSKHNHSHGHAAVHDHSEVAVRLKRVRGHLDKVIEMVESHEPCTDILQQMTAVISALGSSRTLLFSNHLRTCLRPALKTGNEDLVTELEKLATRAMRAN